MKKKIIIAFLTLLLCGCDIVNENINYTKSTDLHSTEQIEYSSSSTIYEENEEEVSSIYTHFNAPTDEWYQKSLSDEYVVTVIGASYCGHCTSFKPIAETISNRYNIDLYYYYVDETEENEYKKLTETYETNYQGSVPHIFITKNGKVITNRTGGMSESEFVEFLKLNLVIE